MILDDFTEMCDATALNTGGAGTYLIGSQIDLTTARDMGDGEQMYLVISVDTAAASGGSATATFQLASDASAAVATDGSATVHAQTAAIPVASLTAGAQFVIPLPSEGNAYERYLGLLQVTGTAAFTAGKVNAFITHDVAKWTAYANAI